MFILPIWLIDGHKWSWNSINSANPQLRPSKARDARELRVDL